MKKILGLLVVFIFILSSFSFSAAQGFSGKKILVLKNVNAWNSDANEMVLTQMGISYDVMTASQLNSLSLSDLINTYDMILIASDQDQTFYNDLGPQMSKLEDFARAGGALEIHAANWGWHGGVWTTPLPGGVEILPSYSNYDYLVKNGTWLYSTYASHGYLANLPGTVHIITVQGNGATPNYNRPSTISYSLGNGQVMATGLTIEYSVKSKGGAWIDLLKWMIKTNLGYKPTPVPVSPGRIGLSQYFLLNYIYNTRYHRELARFNELYNSPEAGELGNETLEEALHYKILAEEFYEKAGEYGPIEANLNSFRVFISLRQAYFAIGDAVDIIEDALE